MNSASRQSHARCYNGGNPTPVASTEGTSAQRWLRNALAPQRGGTPARRWLLCGSFFHDECVSPNNDNLIILTNGFAKKTQKTPSQQIDLAEQRKRDYLNRKESEENDE